MPYIDFSNKDNEKKYFYDGKDLGATYKKSHTKFKVWAPTADRVAVRLYQAGKGDNFIQEFDMELTSKGVWQTKVEEDIKGVYYTYSITIEGKTTEAVDIYAKACGVNGIRGMVVDLSSTNPPEWDKTLRPKFKNPTDAVIYELHIRDFSVDESGHILNKGKYLAFTENGNKNSEGLSTGVDHLKELGITHVHLLPCFDYYSVDEENYYSQFNWGYDPQNYNIPEGSYSTDPANGEVRIKEFKQMVQALHKNQIRVVMDVVYNHTMLTENSNFNKIVPGYYYRHKEDGSFSNGSECGNETASESLMFRKFMVDSVCYWAREYKIDGFRFDLMGLHDIETMNEIREALNKINPSIIIYGEGWAASESPLMESKRAVKANTHFMTGVASFSDDIRDAIKGHVFDAKEQGFVNGKDGLTESIKFGIVGSTRHKQIDYSKVKYSKSAWAKSPTQTVNYCEAHDNLTLWDKLAVSNENDSIEDRIKMDKMAAAIVFTSQGIPFIQAGQEFLRSKPLGIGFDGNSYKSPDSVNSLKWDKKTENKEVFEYYKGLIEFRKAHPALRMTTTKDVSSRLRFMNNLDENVVGFRIVTDNERLIVIHNATKESKMITIPSGLWKVYVDDKKAGTKIIKKIKGGKIAVQPISTLVLARSNNAKTKKTIVAVGAAFATAAIIGTIIKGKSNIKLPKNFRFNKSKSNSKFSIMKIPKSLSLKK